MLLSQPFPSYTAPYYALRLTLMAGIVVFIILALFKPFGIDNQGSHHIVLHAAWYGLATFITTAFNALALPRLFSNIFREEKWTAGKELLMMLWQIITVSLANVVITHILYGEPLTLPSVFNFLGITAAVGIFPVTLIILLKQQMLFKKYSAGAAVLEKQLHDDTRATEMPAPLPHPLPEMVTLTGDNLNEQVLLPLQSIRYVVAADNYIKVHFVENGRQTHKVLRSTLKKAQESLEPHPQMFRCHRAYLVNLSAVHHVSGNAQGFKLHLQDSEELIPVSRSLNKELGLHLNRHSLLSH